MLRDITASLKFPKLFRLGEDKLRNESDMVDIYELKFPCDQIADDMMWKKGRVLTTKAENDEYLQEISRIPPQYKWVHDLRFALKSNYLNEIRRCAVQASLEWSRHRGFDTVIREACLEPAISYIQTIFMLLQDCIYNKEEQYWERNEEKRHLTKYLLGFKFWYGQTGLGCVIPHTGLNNARNNCVERMMAPGYRDSSNYYTLIMTLYETLDGILWAEINKSARPDIPETPKVKTE